MQDPRLALRRLQDSYYLYAPALGLLATLFYFNASRVVGVVLGALLVLASLVKLYGIRARARDKAGPPA